MRWMLGGEEKDLVILMLQECRDVYAERVWGGEGQEGGKEVSFDSIVGLF
jgi:hypothetical protein